MRVLLKTKIGPFLVIFSVLAMWTLLLARPAQAHKSGDVSTPGCSSLPTADAFFNNATIGITATGNSGTASAEEGKTAANSGRTKYRYAKITIPALAAGELRVFDSRTTTTDANSPVSAASLCRRGSQIASFSKSYSSSQTSFQ